jgi:hypothetical protein
MPNPKRPLTKNLREPEKLVLYKLGLYKCTMNGSDPRGHYNQSSLTLLLNLSPWNTVETFQPITMWIAPARTTNLDFMRFHNSGPTLDQLKELEWIEVKIGCSPKQIVVCCGGFYAKCVQCALNHCGALTINKVQGYTIHHVAVEISTASAPWESGQVIVNLSRTIQAWDTIIVGQNIDWVKKFIWDILCTPTRWKCLKELNLSLITLSQFGPVPQLLLTDYHRVYPFRFKDMLIPTEMVGYVYMVISKRDANFTYIGESHNISQRFNQHNKGHAASSDATPTDLHPYALTGLISSLGLVRSVRLALEQKWRVLRNQSNCNSPYAIVKLGELVAQQHNQYLHELGNIGQCVWQYFLED